jgi:S1-C subfamily serine protease
MVTSVRPNSVAATENLQRGMLITHVMNEPVSTVDELVEAIERYDIAEGVRISVKMWDPESRSFLSLYVVLQLPAE